MLVLSRGIGERIQIGDQIEVTVVRIAPGVVRIGIEAPTEMPVIRQEIMCPDAGTHFREPGKTIERSTGPRKTADAIGSDR